MKILFIATGFPPYMFSENIVNGKLILAFRKTGWDVDVLTKKDEGRLYSDEWIYPFDSLREVTHEVSYSRGAKLVRLIDFIFSTIYLGFYPLSGIRWARRAYDKATELARGANYDFIITRSPDDVAHLVGYNLNRKTKIPWIANWNDPAGTIWPEPYLRKYSKIMKFLVNRFEKKALENATVNTFPSETLLCHFKSHFPVMEKAKSLIIPHITLSSEMVNATSRKPTNFNVIKLCHAGNLSLERDPKLLFKAIKRIKDDHLIEVQLEIMGVINDYTESLIEKYGLQHNIKYVGSFTYLDALNKMSNYDALVLLEAKMQYGIFFPSKLVDYCQSNVPILALSPDRGFVKNLFSKVDGGIVVKNDSEEDIYAGLIKLVELQSNGILQEQFDLRAMQKMYSVEEVISSYKNIFNS